MIKFINKPEQLNEKKAKRFLQKSALIFNVSIGKIVYEFVTKDKMLNLNKRFLNHNTDTDIITFVYGTKKIYFQKFLFLQNSQMKMLKRTTKALKMK